MKRTSFLLLSLTLWLAACSSVAPPGKPSPGAPEGVRYEPVAFANLPGWGDAERAKSLEAIVEEVMTKPFTIAELRETVMKVIERSIG